MSERVTLSDEYKMLVDELRQNRLIQLQALASSPVWLGLFFGLLGANQPSWSGRAFLFLVPIPLLFINVLLILDRRGSSDYIIGYIRIAIDQQRADRPGWNHLLPDFRKRFYELQKSNPKGGRLIPQRFDFNVIVIISFFVMSLMCCGLFVGACKKWEWFFAAIASVIGGHTLALVHVMKQAARKENILAAWEYVLEHRPAELSDALRELVEAGVRQRHPQYDDAQVHAEVLRVFYHRRTAQR